MQTVKLGTTARCAFSIVALLLLVASAAAKDKLRTTIKVVNSQISSTEYKYYIPGRDPESKTNCTGNATAIDLGGGIATANGTTTCTTTTTPGTPATTGVRYIPQLEIHAITSKGTIVTLRCQKGFRRCSDLIPGDYSVEVKGNSVRVFTSEIGGKEKEHKVKYRWIGSW
jgi:hypothetical protein